MHTYEEARKVLIEKGIITVAEPEDGNVQSVVQFMIEI